MKNKKKEQKGRITKEERQDEREKQARKRKKEGEDERLK